MQAIRDVPLPVESRESLYRRLQGQGFTAGLQHWMGSNLVQQDGRLTWAFDLPGAQSLYKCAPARVAWAEPRRAALMAWACCRSFQRAAYWKLLDTPVVCTHSTAGTTVHIVRAERSDRWSEKAISQLQRVVRRSEGSVQLHVLPDAGHWLHTDNPAGLLQLLVAQWPSGKAGA